jgi:hypothetical protein
LGRARSPDACGNIRKSPATTALLRILLIGYLYGITSERKLVEELRMHLAWRWFTGLGFDQEIPHHSTFSKNRHGRFQESNLFEELFAQIVRQCVEVGLVPRQAPVGRWQLRGSKGRQGEPDSARTISASSPIPITDQYGANQSVLSSIAALSTIVSEGFFVTTAS